MSVDPIKSLKEYIKKAKKKSRQGMDLSAEGARAKLKARKKQIDAEVRKSVRGY